MPGLVRVHTDAGWHGRIVADNGEPVWTTEVYTDRQTIDEALEVLGSLLRLIREHPEVNPVFDVDERSAPDPDADD